MLIKIAGVQKKKITGNFFICISLLRFFHFISFRAE